MPRRLQRPLLSCVLLLLLSAAQLLSGTTIAIFGDTQTNAEIQRQTFAAVAAHKPDIAFHTGDLTSNGSKPENWEKFFIRADTLLALCPFYPTMGNHERSPEAFLARFPHLQGRTYYTVEYDSLLFIILDCTLDLQPGSEQHTWLSETLAGNPSTAMIVLVHYPIFSSGYHGGDEDLALFLPALFAEHNVRVVFSGHDHDYERLEYNGITYLVSGGGGGTLRPAEQVLPQSKVFLLENSYLVLSRQDGWLDCTAYGLDGAILDTFRILITPH